MYIVGDDVLGVPRPWIKTDKTAGDRHMWHFNSVLCILYLAIKKHHFGRPAVKQVAQLSLPIRASEVYSVSEVILRIVKFCLVKVGKLNFTCAKHKLHCKATSLSR